VYDPPVSVVPKETEKVPVVPDFVFQMESSVSMGGRCSRIREVNAETRVTGSSGPRRRRVPATKWTPPSRRKPPW
jgi:hypothetical protein